MVKIKLLIIIIEEGNDKKINLLLNRFGINIKIVSIASGTASPSVLDYFGLVETKKNLFMAIVSESLPKKIFLRLKNVFQLHKRGRGIAFTIPISSGNKFLADSFNKSILERTKFKMKEKKTIKYHLIMTIVSEGHLEQVMNAVKKVGVQGGTVIKGRELSNIIPKRILGFNIEEEKEIILNIVSDKDKNKVMENISTHAGIKTDAEGICFSLPIEDALGLTDE